MMEAAATMVEVIMLIKLLDLSSLYDSLPLNTTIYLSMNPTVAVYDHISFSESLNITRQFIKRG